MITTLKLTVMIPVEHPNDVDPESIRQIIADECDYGVSYVDEYNEGINIKMSDTELVDVEIVGE